MFLQRQFDCFWKNKYLVGMKGYTSQKKKYMWPTMSPKKLFQTFPEKYEKQCYTYTTKNVCYHYILYTFWLIITIASCLYCIYVFCIFCKINIEILKLPPITTDKMAITHGKYLKTNTNIFWQICQKRKQISHFCERFCLICAYVLIKWLCFLFGLKWLQCFDLDKKYLAIHMCITTSPNLMKKKVNTVTQKSYCKKMFVMIFSFVFVDFNINLLIFSFFVTRIVFRLNYVCDDMQHCAHVE